MNPLGIAIAFTLFWAAIGLGLFLTFGGVIGLTKVRRAYGITAAHSGTHVLSSVSYAVMVIVGLALLLAGAYANYVVLYQ